VNAAAPFVAGAQLGPRAGAVRLATNVRAEDKPAPSAELDRTLRLVFVLANQHRRWELDVLAGRLDSQPAALELNEGLVPAPASSVCGLSLEGYRMLPAIGELPEDEREVFDVLRLQGMAQAEASGLLGVSAATEGRRLSRGLRLLTLDRLHGRALCANSSAVFPSGCEQ
jgi:RNA polymerase sigma-70 factor (ECF subfamily)